jgi:hypothetical protein
MKGGVTKIWNIAPITAFGRTREVGSVIRYKLENCLLNGATDQRRKAPDRKTFPDRDRSSSLTHQTSGSMSVTGMFRQLRFRQRNFGATALSRKHIEEERLASLQSDRRPEGLTRTMAHAKGQYRCALCVQGICPGCAHCGDRTPNSATATWSELGLISDQHVIWQLVRPSGS